MVHWVRHSCMACIRLVVHGQSYTHSRNQGSVTFQLALCCWHCAATTSDKSCVFTSCLKGFSSHHAGDHSMEALLPEGTLRCLHATHHCMTFLRLMLPPLPPKVPGPPEGARGARRRPPGQRRRSHWRRRRRGEWPQGGALRERGGRMAQGQGALLRAAHSWAVQAATACAQNHMWHGVSAKLCDLEHWLILQPVC